MAIWSQTAAYPVLEWQGELLASRLRLDSRPMAHNLQNMRRTSLRSLGSKGQKG
jgi:hypothetical protein